MVFRTLATTLLALLHVAAQFALGGQAPANPASPFTLKQVWALDSTYIDQQHGVTFRYPSIWKAETQFGYHPPTLTKTDGTKPIAGFGYEEGGFPRDHIVGPYSETNLEGFGIVYSALPETNARACETVASSLSETPEHRALILGGRSFSEYDTGGAGMSQSNSGRLYATYAQSTCYLFETDMAISSGALDDFRALRPEQSNFIDKNLLKIMRSGRIAPRE
jgi:hypothetical protein